MKKYIYIFMDDLATILLCVILILAIIVLSVDILFLVLALMVASYEIPRSIVAIYRLVIDIRSGPLNKEVRFSVATDKEGMEFFLKVKYIDLFLRTLI